jgi:hypothetical protein
MPFVRRRDAALEARQVAEKKYRGQLRQALSNPGLSAEQRKLLRHKLEMVGKPRVYDAKSPPPPEAIELPTPTPEFTKAGLMGKRKAALQALARRRGLPFTGTKAALVERLLNV